MALSFGPFAPRPGCPLCGVVATPYNNNNHNGAHMSAPWRNDSDLSVNAAGKEDVEIVYKDSNVTAYLERKFPVSSKGHIIIVLKCVFHFASCGAIQLTNHLAQAYTYHPYIPLYVFTSRAHNVC